MDMQARIALFFVLMAMAFAAFAAGNRAAVRKTIESSTLVTGSIDIGMDGAVQGYRVDKPDEFPKPVLAFVGEAVRGMRFEPILQNGKAVNARASMGLRLVATYAGDDQYRLRLASSSFGYEQGPGEGVTGGKMPPPKYPSEALRANIGGTVYLVLKIGRDGAVEDVAVEQTNLTSLGTEAQVARGRKSLEEASIAQARTWTFRVPTKGELADDPYWSIRVPIAYALAEYLPRVRGYGNWHTYVPGPKHHVPWLSDEENRNSSDAIVAGRAQLVGGGPRLLAPSSEG